MTKRIMKNRVVSGLLIFWFVFALIMFVGCKKEDEPEDVQQTVRPERRKDISVSEKINKVATSAESVLRILYAGHPGSSRETEFVRFLAEHFKEVRKGDLAQFKEEHAEGFDVVILDYDGDGFKSPRPRLSPEYARPTMTVGVAGALICSGMSLKTGYL